MKASFRVSRVFRACAGNEYTRSVFQHALVVDAHAYLFQECFKHTLCGDTQVFTSREYRADKCAIFHKAKVLFTDRMVSKLSPDCFMLYSFKCFLEVYRCTQMSVFHSLLFWDMSLYVMRWSVVRNVFF